MGKKYLVEEVDWEIEAVGKIIAPIIGFGILILINWFFLKSLTKIDIEVIGILIGIGLSLIISCCIFITKIKDGLIDTITTIFKWVLIISFFLMLIGSILAPIIGYYIVYHKINFILWDFIKVLFFNSIILIISTPLVSIIITTIASVIGFILAFPIYKIIYKIKSKRIRKTECWIELKQFFRGYDFKNNIIKFTLFEDKIEFEDAKSHEIILFSFKKRGYNDLKKIQQLTLINMIKNETKTPFKIEVSPYVNICTAYNKFLLKKQKSKEKQNYKKIKKKMKIEIKEKKNLHRQNKKAYKNEIKAGKNW